MLADSPGGDSDSQWPFRRIGGLSLLERNLRALKAAGATRVHVVASPAMSGAVRDHVDRSSGSSRLPQIVLHESDRPVRVSEEELPVLVLNGRFVFPLQLLRDAVATRSPTSYVSEDGQSTTLWITDTPDIGKHPPTTRSGAERLEGGRAPMAADTRARRRDAGRRLRAALRKASDSPLAFRSASLALSRLLFPWPVHPNAISLLTVVVAAGAALVSARGSYEGMLAGSLLFQLASILDGVDGEIARMKFLTSALGEWIDTVCDDLSNIVYLSGVTAGLAQATGSRVWLTFGIATIALTVLAVGLMYWQLVTRLKARSFLALEAELASRPPSGIGPRLLAALEPCIKRPFYTLAFVIFAVIGATELILITTAVAMTLTLVYIGWDGVRRRNECATVLPSHDP